MPKIKFRELKDESVNLSAERFYLNKYFSLFINRYKFSGISKNDERYLLKILWNNGTIAAFIIDGTKQEPSLKQLLSNSSPNTINPNEESENGVLCFVPYAAAKYNIEDEPSVITFVNKRGATFIPSKMQKVNVDCVIGWAHSSHASVRALASFYINRIVDVENTINMNLFVHKLPRLIVCSPEDKKRVEDLMDKIENGEKKLFLSAEDVQAIKNVLETGSNTSYIIDKLYQYKQNLENELLTFFGFNNVPIEKKERLITDEAQSNNQMISDSGDCFLDCLQDFCDEINSVLGYNISVEVVSTIEPVEEEQEEEKEKEENDD